jgi:hypothetical protein
MGDMFRVRNETGCALRLWVDSAGSVEDEKWQGPAGGGHVIPEGDECVLPPAELLSHVERSDRPADLTGPARLEPCKAQVCPTLCMLLEHCTWPAAAGRR